ncbi:MBOAT family O-acyltransferase [Butyrivibrio sp. YAB3001]|uniref:MBOAT family O-acyltransferase n=1 Tax=Butyrivibrio sp. YAB3001 TaxID=1520812 RepID=UPI0008F64C7C|nr:MBOAT family O-acyltransferase [Butyrivibrio sp. YAB3001]SFB96228.1 D-alanyl-lipoteichoic acid acyltransferase DltB, MBOAT superfamily [Butyrivibrio sp. YAB3001]
MVYSFSFLLFVAILLLVYYSIFKNHQWIVLLVGSIGFYLYTDLRYSVFLVVTTVMTFLGAIKLEQFTNYQKNSLKDNKERWTKEEKKAFKAMISKKKKLLLTLIAVVAFGMLMVFKCKKFLPFSWLILPLGMSFYTFQSIGYLIDVYRGEVKAERNFLHYALFVSYFPQIIQGPINRFDKLNPQFFQRHKFDFAQVRSGLWLFLWGLFKKLVIADRLSLFVNTVTEQTDSPAGSIVITAVFLFNIQLYADFSGGIDMVRGISEMFGITLEENFRRPFFATTIGEYWHRWHMSLSNWIRDYVFYPLAFSKTYANFSSKLSKRNAHLGKTIPAGIVSVITFLLIGLWHEFSFAYIAYGLWHGIVMASAQIFEPVFSFLNRCFSLNNDSYAMKLFGRARTWILISIGEMFTITGSFSGFLRLTDQIIHNFKWYRIITDIELYSLTYKDFFVVGVGVVIWYIVSIRQESGMKIREHIAAQPWLFRYALTAGVIMITLIFGIYGSSYNAADFIYGGF